MESKVVALQTVQLHAKQRRRAGVQQETQEGANLYSLSGCCIPSIRIFDVHLRQQPAIFKVVL